MQKGRVHPLKDELDGIVGGRRQTLVSFDKRKEEPKVEKKKKKGKDKDKDEAKKDEAEAKDDEPADKKAD
jgi:hypothetical protein